jgi:Xaa-Pro dipeptidase
MGIAPDEYRRRLESLRASVRQAGLDVFLVSALDSIYYLTGAGFEPLERPFFLIVRPEGHPDLLVPELDYEHMKKAHNICPEHIHSYWDFPAPPGRGWPDRLCERISDAQQVGVEPTIPQDIARELRGHTVRVEPLVERLRSVKSGAEVEMICRAARFADLGVSRLLAASYFGATVAEGFAETRAVTTRIIKEVDDWEALTTRVVMATWPAPWSAMPHSVPDLNDQLREGPHVALVLTRVNGYAAESERTYFTAEPSEKAREAFKAMMAARKIAFDRIRPGVPCSEIDSEVTEYLSGRGFSADAQRLHRTGHGIGLGNHEAPWIALGSDDRLAENMVISVEPGIYAPQAGGFRHSDTVLVTKDGYESLTKHPTDLETLIIRGWKPFRRIWRRPLVSWALGLARMPRRTIRYV